MSWKTFSRYQCGDGRNGISNNISVSFGRFYIWHFFSQFCADSNGNPATWKPFCRLIFSFYLLLVMFPSLMASHQCEKWCYHLVRSHSFHGTCVAATTENSHIDSLWKMDLYRTHTHTHTFANCTDPSTESSFECFHKFLWVKWNEIHKELSLHRIWNYLILCVFFRQAHESRSMWVRSFLKR